MVVVDVLNIKLWASKVGMHVLHNFIREIQV